MYATLEMNDLEGYTTEDWKGKDMPTKASTILPDVEKSDTAKTTLAAENKLVRKEMKKAKSHMVRVSKDYPKCLVMDAETPYEAYVALKTKYSVA